MSTLEGSVKWVRVGVWFKWVFWEFSEELFK